MPEKLPTRIMVYGTTGSGKSTLASRIAEVTGLPYHAIDNLTWLPDWQEVPDGRQREVIGELVAGDAWVIDAGYGKWLDLVLPRVELIVGLDYPGPLIFWRLLRRSVSRIVTGEAVCNGNRERLGKLLNRDSILLWFFKSYRRKRARMRSLFKELPCDLVVFTWPRQATAWLRELKPSKDPASPATT